MTIMLNNKFVSKLLGLALIGVSISFFIYSLDKRIKKAETQNNVSIYKKMRISADSDNGKLYLWGAEQGMYIRASEPINYIYKKDFYIISIADVYKPYVIEVYKGDKIITRFRYFLNEPYPLYSD